MGLSSFIFCALCSLYFIAKLNTTFINISQAFKMAFSRDCFLRFQHWLLCTFETMNDLTNVPKLFGIIFCYLPPTSPSVTKAFGELLIAENVAHRSLSFNTDAFTAAINLSTSSHSSRIRSNALCKPWTTRVTWKSLGLALWKVAIAPLLAFLQILWMFVDQL